MNAEKESPLNAAIRQFELAEANLVKLERLWAKIEAEIPAGIEFGDSPVVENFRRAYSHILQELPAIDGMKPATLPMDLDEIAQSRLDANEVGEIECRIAVEQHIGTPGRELREYRFNLERSRRQLVRRAVEDKVAEVDSALRILRASPDYSKEPGELVEAAEWPMLKGYVDELAMMLGKDVPRTSRWPDLNRHLRFGQSNDLRDVVEHDWPDVKALVMDQMFGEDDPLPVAVADLADLVRARPTGPVATQLAWSSLTPEDFERLIFMLVSTAAGYENAEWLMRTNAADRGRDISAYRVVADPLAGTIRHRVIIQCKHWLTKSIAVSELAVLREQMKLWEPPRVDVHVIATSGRFTADGVQWIERHNQSDTALRIEMWPDSHLERLLAARPELIATFSLR
jgi:hypothetical protein